MPKTETTTGSTDSNSSEPSLEETRAKSLPRRFFAALGPGVVTGAADDDPAGITTYSVAGAQFGTSFLWTALVTWPLMGFVQMMCAKIGMVTGRGLLGALRKKFPRPLIIFAAGALFLANTINIGADLAGMADAVAMLWGLNSRWFVVLFAAGIAIATVRCRYAQIANILKWLVFVLFAYIITAFILRPDWQMIGRAAVTPTLPQGQAGWAMLVAILGTTISPYLFFWQSSQEVEEEKMKGRRTVSHRKGASRDDLVTRQLDVGVGTFFSNLVMFFIILTCAITLHAHGITEIETSRQAAEALKPLAGSFATTLYTLGIVGLGLLAIPTLAGSAAYAFAEAFYWKQGLDEKYSRAPKFYGVVIASMAAALLVDFSGINPVKALYWSAIINGLLAPFLLVGILLVARDRELMHNQPASAFSFFVVGLTTLIMFGAAISMFVV